MEQIKKTALLTAACRAKFNASTPWKEKHIYKDLGAELIIHDPSEFDTILSQFPPKSEEVFGIRFHWQIEKLMERLSEIQTSVQVVILGAGMDMSYLKLMESELWTKVSGYYEVDLPITQSHKKELTSHISNSKEVIYVNCNFNEESFLDCLTIKGWQKDNATIFVWMGVSYYLLETAVHSTLKLVSQTNPNSCLIMDYASPMPDDKQVTSSEKALKNLNEPILFKCHDLASLVATFGFKKIDQTSFLSEVLNQGGEIIDPDDKRLLKFSVIYLS